ncbi:acyl-CoA synthetase (AMP-forming)/AMP-acid ligase II [Kutzneria viridogrisea]|uniref:Acyl-CoA synthetase (AMP-forming)/AMP-acid ligase II n=1 Tax=Kutzneria viridogrisea TaxID=47990 RepID=A0ABR6BV26_9PSEU|nr:acyl-CoA synthetase (AMP-forming)/AMP-acid ligase II [Kutzneria viridogrisea]
MRRTMRPALLDGETLGESLARLAKASPDSRARFPTAGDEITAAELDLAATAAAHEFLRAGIRPGEVVGVLVPTAARFLTTIYGLWRAGAAISVLPVQAGFGDVGGTARRLARIAGAADMRHLVLDPSHDDLARALGELRTGVALVPPPAPDGTGDPRALPTVDPEALAIVQFTSGSTSLPKGVMLPHRTTMAGLRSCVIAGAFSPDDVFVQWVPTFHDMGLIGLQSHWLNGADVHAFAPTTFLRRPGAVLEHFAAHGGTVMTGPNFSYDYVLDNVPAEQLAALDLSSWRLAFNGAEPISAATVRRFTEALAPSGVDASVMYPVYGMAEATLSISYPEPGATARIRAVDRNELARTGEVRAVAETAPGAKPVVSVGRPVHGIDLRVVREDGAVAADGALGEIQISGEPVTTGYFRNPEATAEAFDQGWLRTGDLGFLLDGELYVTGRCKEMVVVHGQNFFPDDVENLARTVPGVYRRRCVAFSDLDAEGGERIGVIVETGEDPAAVCEEVRRRVAAELDLSQVQVYAVKPRWIPRTTSGKWQRVLAAQRVTSGEAEGVFPNTASADQGERV